ncbi:uncharacterized [Lates japonicus]
MHKAAVGAHTLLILMIMTKDELVLLHSQVGHLIKDRVSKAAAFPSLAHIAYEVPADAVQRQSRTLPPRHRRSRNCCRFRAPLLPPCSQSQRRCLQHFLLSPLCPLPSPPAKPDPGPPSSPKLPLLPPPPDRKEFMHVVNVDQVATLRR